MLEAYENRLIACKQLLCVVQVLETCSQSAPTQGPAYDGCAVCLYMRFPPPPRLRPVLPLQ